MKLALDLQRTAQRTDDPGLRGTNQSGMREQNERLVLSLVRQQGALAKTDIARITGLSAQTVSVIMRSLESEGLLLRGEPVRGRIGQPSVPMSLNPDGAFFFGLKIGRRSADLTLIDFQGHVRATRRQIYRYPTPSTVIAFVAEAMPAITAILPPPIKPASAAWASPCHSSCGIGCSPSARRRPKWMLGATVTFRPNLPN